jgi:phosphoribosylglycinamide formyltransferase-1
MASLCVVDQSSPGTVPLLYQLFEPDLEKNERQVMDKKIQIAVFASGSGTNAERLMEYFRVHEQVEVCLIVCNNPKAGVLEKAARYGVEVLMIEKERFMLGDGYEEALKDKGIEWIVLAGFLWKIPHTLIEAFPNRIVNIHPALLPKYGGKGMYGMRVHEAVLAAKEPQSGITIHFVDEIYDHGKIIFKAECAIEANEKPETLAKKVQVLEHQYYAKIVEEVVRLA